MTDGTLVQRAESSLSDTRAAVVDIVEQLGTGSHAGIFIFCSADYDLEILGPLLQEHFSGPLIGCTTAGEIGTTYSVGGIVAAAFSTQAFVIHPKFIPDIQGFDERNAMQLANELRASLEWSGDFSEFEMFGMLLIDGLSMIEESVIAAIFNAMRESQYLEDRRLTV